MNTLIINTYAGSLLVGANAIPGSRIIGSYEDVGFGAAITKANRARFTEASADFSFVDRVKDWPDHDLSEVVVLAHPPCAAFSAQNTLGPRGTDTDAFACTKQVLRYTMGHNAAAIAVESVVPAMAGAWDFHNEMARRGGYHVYRVLQNSALFGVPQNRERFWAVFVRRGLATPSMRWTLQPRVTRLRDVLDPLLPGTPGVDQEAFIERLLDRLVREQGITRTALERVVFGKNPGTKRESFENRVGAAFFPGQDPQLVRRDHIIAFSASQPTILPERGLAPVLLANSLWIYKGQAVPEEGYKAIMGFPPDYVFPEGTLRKNLRMFLSKGVCPPVATWVLDNIRRHLGHRARSPLTTGLTGGYQKDIGPGRIVSFRVSKKELGRVLEDGGKPVLRNEEEELES